LITCEIKISLQEKKLFRDQYLATK